MSDLIASHLMVLDGPTKGNRRHRCGEMSEEVTIEKE